MKSKATMRDVAAAARVSMKTVSRVINGEPGVSAELTDRVREAVDELQYRHNLAASNLRRGQRTRTIGVLIQDNANNFSAHLLRAVDDAAYERQIAVFTSSLDEQEERELQLVRNLVARQIDGLILMPATSDQSYLARDLADGLSVVVVDRPPHGLDTDCVLVDNDGGTRTAIEHLLGLGHRRIALLADDLTIATASSRRQGYRAALASAGIAVLPDLERTGLRTAQAGYDATISLLASPEPPTALFAARNELTTGVVAALQHLGCSRSVALIGFDEVPLAELLEPPVATVQQSPTEVGRAAAAMLFERMDGYDGAARTVTVETTFAERTSGNIPPR